MVSTCGRVSSGKEARNSVVEGGGRGCDARCRVLSPWPRPGRRAAAPPRGGSFTSPQRGGIGLGGRVTGPARVLVLPVVDQVGPPLGLDRPACQRVQDAATPRSSGVPEPALLSSHRNHRSACRDPASPVPGTASFSTRRDAASASSAAIEYSNASSGSRSSAPVGGAALRPASVRAPRRSVRPAAWRGTSGGSGTTPRAGPAGPAASSTGPDPPGSRPIRAAEHRLAQRPGHTLQRRSPGQERPLLRRQGRCRNSDSMYWLTSRSAPSKETAARAGEPPSRIASAAR